MERKIQIRAARAVLIGATNGINMVAEWAERLPASKESQDAAEYLRQAVTLLRRITDLPIFKGDQ